MATWTVVKIDGTTHSNLHLAGSDNGGPTGLNFHFIDRETGERMYLNTDADILTMQRETAVVPLVRG